MKNKYLLIPILAVSLLFVQCSKKEKILGCTDENGFNYDPAATSNCCCEYLMTFDPEGTGNNYTISWKDENGTVQSVTNATDSWTDSYVATLGASVSLSVTNLNPNNSTSAIATIWIGNEVFEADTAFGSGATASVSGTVN